MFAIDLQSLSKRRPYSVPKSKNNFTELQVCIANLFNQTNTAQGGNLKPARLSIPIIEYILFVVYWPSPPQNLGIGDDMPLTIHIIPVHFNLQLSI